MKNLRAIPKKKIVWFLVILLFVYFGFIRSTEAGADTPVFGERLSEVETMEGSYQHVPVDAQEAARVAVVHGANIFELLALSFDTGESYTYTGTLRLADDSGLYAGSVPIEVSFNNGFSQRAGFFAATNSARQLVFSREDLTQQLSEQVITGQSAFILDSLDDLPQMEMLKADDAIGPEPAYELSPYVEENLALLDVLARLEAYDPQADPELGNLLDELAATLFTNGLTLELIEDGTPTGYTLTLYFGEVWGEQDAMPLQDWVPPWVPVS